MARIRSIKPDIASDAKLAALPADVFRTFILCISQADDMGLLYASPRVLIGSLYPVDETTTEAKLAKHLQQLLGHGMLRRLQSADGTPLLHLTNWERHQSVEKPHFSVISRSLVPDEPVGHNSRMTKEQFEKLSRIIRESGENDSTNDSPNDSPNPSRIVRDRIRDKGYGIGDRGRTAVQGNSPVVEDLPPRETATAGAHAPRTAGIIPYPYSKGAA